ncbi:MAG: acyl-CoA dehydrogenase [Gammaproteobacteria bacterium]|nr:acyl-CoA dehydrogenase [Gammaproteobacteria bacterium]
MTLVFFLLYLVFTLIALNRRSNPMVWEVGSGFYLFIATFVIGLPWLIGLVVWVVVIAAILVLRLEGLRARISSLLFRRAAKAIPRLSPTEETALNAGDTWIEQDVFRGTLDWDKLSQIGTELSREEQSFLDNETQTLCSMMDEWDIEHNYDLPQSVWTYIKKQGFLGLVIPKEYGGKGFSARAHSDIVMKISSRSGVGAVTVMVPNSLGPGELLVHYGTEEQKKHYLPRLAEGTDIPCFALTEPQAGSDATSIQSEAIVMKQKVKGKSVLGLSITLSKRWITLAPVATLIGLALNLRDPDGLLGEKGSEGITCVLMARDTEGLEIGNRHLPLQQPFMNGTIRGKDIFVPITQIIGGQENAGRGWEMLVECLSIGRSISLPALSAGASGIAYLTSGAFGRIRRQFHLEIGQFEGVEEKLAEIAGRHYLVNATRLLTLAAVNEGKKPSVASALTKYYTTELARSMINDAMDIHGGRAVVQGPRNYLASYYAAIPIFITVEGANIMSRNLLVFGQGSIACHPYLREELTAVRQEDHAAFHQVIWQHIHYFAHNFGKAICSAWTGGRFVTVPDGLLKPYFRRLTRLTYAYAWLADVALIFLGGAFKRKERLSARLADGMSYLYMATAALRLAESHHESDSHRQHAIWAVTYCFYWSQKAMLEFCQNFPSRILGTILRLLLFPFGQTMRYPSDETSHELAQLMQRSNGYRSLLKRSVFLSGDAQQPVDRMEHALDLLSEHAELYRSTVAKSHGKRESLRERLLELVEEGQIQTTDVEVLLNIEQACWDAIQVDEFEFDDIERGKPVEQV